eukprot:UN24198
MQTQQTLFVFWVAPCTPLFALFTFVFRVSLDMMTVQANTGPKWEDKINKAVFRGRDSRQERLDLVVMGRKKPEIYDVALSNSFFKYEEEKYGPMNR